MNLDLFETVTFWNTLQYRAEACYKLFKAHVRKACSDIPENKDVRHKNSFKQIFTQDTLNESYEYATYYFDGIDSITAAVFTINKDYHEQDYGGNVQAEMPTEWLLLEFPEDHIKEYADKALQLFLHLLEQEANIAKEVSQQQLARKLVEDKKLFEELKRKFENNNVYEN